MQEYITSQKHPTVNSTQPHTRAAMAKLISRVLSHLCLFKVHSPDLHE